MAVSAASAMSLKRSISSLDLAADARAARARRSAQPSNKEGLEDPTLETPLKDTGLPPSPPAPPIDGRTLSDLEVLFTIATTGDGAWRRSSDSATRRQFETLVQLLADKTTTDKTTTDKGVNDLGPLRCGQVTAKMCIRCGEPIPPNEMVPQCHWCGGRCCSFGCVLAHDNVCRAKPEGGEVDQVDGQQTLAGVGRSKQEQDQELPPAKGWKKYDTTYWEQEGCNLHLDLDQAHALAAKGLPDDGSNRSESFLDARRGAYWSRKLSAPKDPPEALEDLGPVALPPKDKGEDKHNVSLLRVATSSPPVSWPALPCGNIGNCPCISCTRRCIAPDPAARAPTHQADVGSPPKFSQWSPSSSPTTNSDLAFGADPFGDRAASEDPLIRMTPWPCARCNREPIDTVWRPLDGATAFDTEERICGACWLVEDDQGAGRGDTEDLWM